MAGPILIFLIVGLLDPWVRESVVFFAFAIVSFAGHASFLWLTWPSRANKSFPYHVKTSSIGIASNDDDGADYPRHTYEPASALPDATIIIPLSRRTEEFVTARNNINNNNNNGGIYNAGFIRDTEYIRSNAPASIPQQCLPSQRYHTRLPSPTHEMPSITNDRLYGKDTLNNEDDDDISDTIETESGDPKKHQNSTDINTVNNRMSSFESEDSAVVTCHSSHVNGNENLLRQNSAGQDNDSGHLSLEATSSPNSNGTASTPQSNSLENSKSTDDLPQILKENPFKAKAQNKIILDPIKLPDGFNNAHPGVPRHLFTVGKRSD